MKFKIDYKQIEDRKNTLDWFQNVQLAKLIENVHKGSWKERTIPFLLKRIKQEIEELEHAIELGNHNEIYREAGDIANFAMFIADKFRN